MQTPEVIRRQWRGFGECRITVAPFEASVQRSLADKIFCGLPMLFTRTGLGSLSFTIDPDWILQENPPASPIAVKFLRIHRRALAEEWSARQHASRHATQRQESSAPAVAVAQIHDPAGPPPRRRRGDRIEPETKQVRRQSRAGANGLPSWFESISHSSISQS
jgi:hypothetical protein